ncbi:hypothetical protein [Roseisalinus antarcticus]|uniref:Uncharacterized protein n=1 Tax=Roseisalinus antarcticus TaxID=254357 RepID=A0A1Y5RAP0_9RHOB|nr:hypothetical protein [Roseisalinus antarcticus]SLN13017.1 hypothetical protein ROA7023_00025 [Roseisalinus antarcticus]
MSKPMRILLPLSFALLAAQPVAAAFDCQYTMVCTPEGACAENSLAVHLVPPQVPVNNTQEASDGSDTPEAGTLQSSSGGGADADVNYGPEELGTASWSGSAIRVIEPDSSTTNGTRAFEATPGAEYILTIKPGGASELIYFSNGEVDSISEGLCATAEE